MERTTKRFVKLFLSSLDTPRSLSVWLLFSNGEHDQLTELVCNPHQYTSAMKFRDDYAATSLLSKADFLNTTFDRKQVARRKFLEAEEQCRLKNLDLRDPLYFYKNGCEPIIFRASQIIHAVLGSFSCDEWMEACEFGPGVTQIIKGDVSRARKFQCETGITTALNNLLGDLHKVAYENWPVEFTVQDSNSVITVPKNSKTDRTIAIEPGINLWYQKGIGTMIRRRLLRVGLDLNEKGKTRKRNQLMSQRASISRHLATVDFSAASDTISRSIVETLIGGDWLQVLLATRSKLGRLEDETIVYSKFSSMGNGYTFELETLIFYALALACCESVGVDSSDVSVFGDDVIIPVDVFELYSNVTKLCGFTVNPAKSFFSGAFRESCGDHWFDGVDCKPYFLKKDIKDELDVYKSANGIRRLAHRRNHYGCDISFRAAWLFLRLPSKSSPLKGKACLISEGFGDGGFAVNFDEATPSKAKNSIEGFFAHHKVFVSKTVHHDSHGALLARVRKGSQDRAYGNRFDLRDRGQYKRKRVLIPQWVDFGPWV